MNEHSSSVTGRRNRGIARLLKNARGTPEELRRLGDYCDAAYRIGYRAALNKKAKEQRQKRQDAAAFRRESPTYVAIETDTPMECPICGVEIPAGVKHEHGSPEAHS
jgi:hypothetical protein